MGPIGSFADLMSMLRRRIVPFAVILSLGMLAALVNALSQPAVFETSTLIQLRNTGLAGDDPAAQAQRLQVIEQQLMRRDNVLALIEKHELFKDESAMSDDDKLFAFRDSNRISIIDSAGGGTTPGTGREVAALLISSKAGTPRQAAQVANDLAASLIAQDREERTRGTEEALTFLNGEAGRLSRQLARVDAQIGEVKNANEESLPEAAEALRSEMAQLRELQLELERQSLALERDQLDAQMRAEEPDSEDADTTVASRLARLSSELTQARRLLPDDHPEVRRIQNEIASIRSSGAVQTVSQLDREVALIESQRNALERQKRTIAARQEEIERALERAPLIEQELAGFQRQQAQLVQQLSDVALQLAQAQSRQSLQDNRTSGSMVVLEEARAPDYPLSSSRKRVMAMGAAGSFALALIAIFLMEARRPVLRTAAAVERKLGVVPIAAIPQLPSPARRVRQSSRYALAAVIFAASAALGVHLYLGSDEAEDVAATPAVAAQG